MSEADAIEGVPPPEANTQVHGHDGVRAAMGAVIGSGRIPGAMMLHGPHGIGKATLSFSLARQLLGLGGDETQQRIAEQVGAGAHPNMFLLRRQPRDGKGFYSVIRVEEIRELRERLRRTRGRSGYRVAVVDSIDDCNPSAANALLKMLEEPPPETVFILVSHRPGSLLPTIRSRCQRFAMRPIGEGDVADVLRRLRPDVGHVAIVEAAALSAGRPRRALEALRLEDGGQLATLRVWLASPPRRTTDHLALADALGVDAGSAVHLFARDLTMDWIGDEARAAALEGSPGRARLASANVLWEKASDLLAETDALNLDARQTLSTIFDAIDAHRRAHQLTSAHSS